MVQTPPAIRQLAGLSDLAGRYDAVILDLWGVVHDGYAAYPGALACLAILGGEAVQRLFLSNAPRGSDRVVRRLDELGIPGTAYDHIITSGDLTRRALERRDDAWHAALGRAYYHLGPHRDAELIDGLAYRAVARLADADFILNTGLVNDETETVAAYESLLDAALARRLPMICANPDLSVVRGLRSVPCAGAVAAAYAARGGPTRYHGKPHPPSYAACFERFDGIDRRRILAIGDSLHTDIAGAVAAGLDALLVTGGVHADELGLVPGELADPHSLAELCAGAGHRPVAALAALAW